MRVVASSVLQKKLPTICGWWVTLDYLTRAITAWINSLIVAVVANVISHLSMRVVWRFCRLDLSNLLVSSVADGHLKARCYYPYWL